MLIEANALPLSQTANRYTDEPIPDIYLLPVIYYLQHHFTLLIFARWQHKSWEFTGFVTDLGTGIIAQWLKHQICIIEVVASTVGSETMSWQSLASCSYLCWKRRRNMFTGYWSRKLDLKHLRIKGQFRVTTCLENLEMSGNLTAVREMSGILLKVREVSG